MFQTIIDLYDVFRTDVDIGEEFAALCGLGFERER